MVEQDTRNVEVLGSFHSAIVPSFSELTITYRQHESKPCHLEVIIIIKCIADWQLIGVVGVVTHCTDNDITLNV